MGLEDDEFVEDIDDELNEDDFRDDDLEQSSYVCEDCDYRWEDLTDEERDSGLHVCPMCGSTNVTQL